VKTGTTTDTKLAKEAMRRTRIKSIREVVEFAIHELIKKHTDKSR
jgi:Arc/MetJ family transcription regulator